MSANDLQALFAGLRPKSHPETSASPGPATSTQQTSQPASSTYFKTLPGSSTPPPLLPSTIDERGLKPHGNTNGTRTASGATAQNLLNLLNFGGAQSGNSFSAAKTPISTGSGSDLQSTKAPISASDLVARFMSPTAPVTQVQHEVEKSPAVEVEHTTQEIEPSDHLDQQDSSSHDPVDSSEQDLKQEQKESDVLADTPLQSIETAVADSAVLHRESPVRIFGTTTSRGHTPFEPPKSASPMPQDRKSIFTYTNPFEALNASRQQTPGVASPVPVPAQPSTPATFNFEPPQSVLSPVEVISTRKKLTPKLRSQRSTISGPRESSPAPAAETSQGLGTAASPSTNEYLQPSIEASEVQVTDEPHVQESTVAEQVPEQNRAPIEDTQDNQDESGEWEDADEPTDRDAAPRQIPVYNFPIKAFVSITLHLGASSDIGIRDDGVMEISRLKKEFDQLDRSLAAATSKYITYAFVKNGGMRIIRQDDGSDRHVFKNSHDRIFNVAFCTTAVSVPPSDNQAVLGTGVSGAVYYASLSKEGNDLFEKNQLDSESLIFPPSPQADENTAGGILKTRAKRSSRHPEFFAIGRGKSIHLIWPATALSPRYGINDTNRTVDVEKYYADRPLQILTGKAGKDFTFSEDDTVIVSLDKTGRLRFWDIRPLVDEANATAARVEPIIVHTPILSLSTASPSEKSWPTSVTFVDKARPYRKGGALRYVLVGLRQNHTLQLWDIALNKAVQELNFPHESETDGICSVNYHPESGIIVVSHPTRNSIFFIHLSAPRYALPSSYTQATYIQRIAAKDSDLPKPESTACMSGIREISFAQKGNLRSVELLSVQKSVDAGKEESATLFELYVVHSKGVTCLGITKEDLGWNADSKVLYPIDAQQEGLVMLKDLKLGSVIEEPIRSQSPVKEAQPVSKASKKKSKKAGQQTENVVNGVDDAQSRAAQPMPAATSTSTDVIQPEPVSQDIQLVKDSKKAKKKVEKPVPTAEPLPAKEELPPSASPVRDLPAQPNAKPEVSISSEKISNEIKEARFGVPDGKELAKLERTISDLFKKEIDALHQSIQSDRSAQDLSSASRQEALLRIVSTTLATNVEKSLSKILAQQMQQEVVPSLIQNTSTQITNSLVSTLNATLPQQISTHLPNAVGAALQNPQLSRSVAEAVSQKLSKQLETQLADMVVKSVTPLFKGVAASAAEKASLEVESRLGAQIRQLQLDRAADNEKLDRLGNILQGMASALQTMSDSQISFQGQILRDRQALAATSNSSTITTSRQVSTARGTPDPPTVSRPKSMRIRSKAEIELEEITRMMEDGNYEEGSIKWLQSAQPVKLFDDLFVRFTPEYLHTDVSPLVAFSVAVTVANSLTTNTERRLEWISSAFDAVDLQDPEIADLSQHAPSLINSLIQKLESMYMTTAERNPSDPVLRLIPALAKKARDLKAGFIARAAGPIVTLPQLTGPSY